MKGKGFRGKTLSATLSCKIHLYSPVRGAFTIMWMQFLGGSVEKILKTLSTASNSSADFERSSPRNPIRSTRVWRGLAAMGLESLG